MAQSEKELEKQLMEAGNALLSPPSSVTELLALLDRVENSLTRVEQSPSESMKKALSSSMKALVAHNLLRHSDVDVKVAVASCISEITRITAPDAPYEDEQMKEVFQLIVSSFEKLHDKSSPSYVKRTSILETVAKVRSCVVMLDLECDALILDMFKHFFRSIRDDQPENVFFSMETIMTLVLEESEDVSLDLLSSILDFLRTENKEVLPIARQLAENVIVKCATKLKPYLLPAVKSRGACLDHYSKIVANVCQTGLEAVEPSDGDAASKKLADESDLANVPPEKEVEVAMETLGDAPPDEEVGPASVGSPKSVMSNGTLQKEMGDTSAGDDHNKEADHDNDQVKTVAESVAEPSKTDTESLVAEEPAKSQTKPVKSNKRKGRKTNALKSSSEPVEPSHTHDKKEAIEVPENQEKDIKEADSAKTDDHVADAAEPFQKEKDSDAPVTSPKRSENEPVDVPSPSCSDSLADQSRSKKVGRGKKKDDSMQESEPTGDVDSKKESSARNTPEGTSVSETKSHKRSVKKTSSATEKEANVPSPVDASNMEDKIPSPVDASNKEDKIPSPVDASNKEDDGMSDLDTKLAKQSGKKVGVVSNQREDKKKKGQVKGTSAKDLAKTPSKDVGKKPLPKSAGKSTKDESDAEKASKSSSKRKRSPGEEKDSKTKGYGPELIGSKVKVWWPFDKKYYEGVVDSFDPVKMKHTILYNDGEVELLKLAREKWQLIDDESAADEGHSGGGESPDESSETPKGKKAKTSVDPGSKPGKTESSSKKGSASYSKSKATPKSVGKSSKSKQQDGGKIDKKTEEESSKKKSVGKSDEGKDGESKSSKAGNKSSDDTPKSVLKPKEDDDADTPKVGNRSKQNTPKGTAKSKGKSVKSGSKSNTNGTGKLKVGVSSKEDEEMSPEPAKTPEPTKGKSPGTSKSQKSGKKRKRVGKR